jgi:hypothetical protein
MPAPHQHQTIAPIMKLSTVIFPFGWWTIWYKEIPLVSFRKRDQEGPPELANILSDWLSSPPFHWLNALVCRGEASVGCHSSRANPY